MNTTLRNSKIMDAYKCLNLSETGIDTLSDEATDWANTHGIVMRNRKNLDLINFAPFTLFPSPFPEYLYKEAFDVHKSFQTLMHKCSSDHDFLESSLKRYVGFFIHPDCGSFLSKWSRLKSVCFKLWHQSRFQIIFLAVLVVFAGVERSRLKKLR